MYACIYMESSQENILWELMSIIYLCLSFDVVKRCLKDPLTIELIEQIKTGRHSSRLAFAFQVWCITPAASAGGPACLAWAFLLTPCLLLMCTSSSDEEVNSGCRIVRTIRTFEETLNNQAWELEKLH